MYAHMYAHMYKEKKRKKRKEKYYILFVAAFLSGQWPFWFIHTWIGIKIGEKKQSIKLIHVCFAVNERQEIIDAKVNGPLNVINQIRVEEKDDQPNCICQRIALYTLQILH